jgi:hypothetical protein
MDLFFLFRIQIYCFRWDVEIEATRAIIKKLNQMEPKPKFFIVCGDIVDAFDCEKDSLNPNSFDFIQF